MILGQQRLNLEGRWHTFGPLVDQRVHPLVGVYLKDDDGTAAELDVRVFGRATFYQWVKPVPKQDLGKPGTWPVELD